MSVFNPSMKFENCLGQIRQFDVLMNSACSEFLQNMHQALYKCLFNSSGYKWINWIFSKSNCNILKIIFILGLYESLKGKIRDGIFFCVNQIISVSLLRTFSAYRIVASTNTCYYSEIKIFIF